MFMPIYFYNLYMKKSAAQFEFTVCQELKSVLMAVVLTVLMDISFSWKLNKFNMLYQIWLYLLM